MIVGLDLVSSTAPVARTPRARVTLLAGVQWLLLKFLCPFFADLTSRFGDLDDRCVSCCSLSAVALFSYVEVKPPYFQLNPS